MKKFIYIFALLVAPIFLSAQGVGVGIKAGANFANLSTDNFSTSSLTRYHIGAYANIKFSDKWGVTPELLWSAQGADTDGGELKMEFVTVPIMLRWRVIKLISLEAGPQFNFLTDDNVGDLESNTFSMAFGGLVHLPLGFHGGLRYVMGMSDLAEADNVDVKDATIQVSIGWTILGAK